MGEVNRLVEDVESGARSLRGDDVTEEDIAVRRNEILQTCVELGQLHRKVAQLRMPLFNAFREAHLALAGEQGHNSHLAQIHPHRIIGFVQRPWGRVQIPPVRAFSQVNSKFQRVPSVPEYSWSDVGEAPLESRLYQFRLARHCLLGDLSALW